MYDSRFYISFIKPLLLVEYQSLFRQFIDFDIKSSQLKLKMYKKVISYQREFEITILAQDEFLLRIRTALESHHPTPSSPVQGRNAWYHNFLMQVSNISSAKVSKSKGLTFNQSISEGTNSSAVTSNPTLDPANNSHASSTYTATVVAGSKGNFLV